MASNEEKWLDNVSRLNGDEQEVLYQEYNTGSSDPKESFYGFRGLDYANTYLYRVLRPLEDIEDGILCQNQSSDRTAVQHIASGSTYGSRFISTTLDYNVAALWAFYNMGTPERRPRDKPLRIVRIDVQVLVGTQTEKNCINLCDKVVREHFIKGALHRNWAISSKEVLFQYKIPKYVRESDKVNIAIQQPTSNPGPLMTVPGMTVPNMEGLFSTYCSDDMGWDKQMVYYVTTDIQQPPQPKAKKPSKKKSNQLEEKMAELNI